MLLHSPAPVHPHEQYKEIGVNCEPLTDGDGDHEEDLGSTADQNTQHHALPGWSEHVPVHQLPSELLLGILLWGRGGEVRGRGGESGTEGEVGEVFCRENG